MSNIPGQWFKLRGKNSLKFFSHRVAGVWKMLPEKVVDDHVNKQGMEG